jgi:hypothetical protein
MATKSPINAISGLASLEPTTVGKVDPTIQALATDTGSTSTDILANMQKRAAELTSPWHAFQTNLDDMIARTHYDPTQAIASMNQTKANEAAELQNIGTTKAQVDLLRRQIGNMNASFNEISGKGGTPTTGGAPTTAGGAVVKVDGVDIPFTPDEIRVAKGYLIDGNVAGYQAYTKERANIYSKANVEAKNAQDLERLKKELGFQGIGGMDTVETVLPLMLDGKPVKESILLTKDELRLIGQNILPKRLTDMGYSLMPIQKKAAGGVIRQNYLADGQQPTPVDPLGNVTSSIPSQDYDSSMLENVLGAITGSGNAQAKESSVTLGPPTVGYGLNPKALERQQQGQIEAGLENLKSSNKERNAELEALAQTEAKKKAEYQGSLEKAENTYKVLKQLKDNSIGYPHLFNLKGTGLAGPILSAILPDVDASKSAAGNAKSKNDLIAQYTLFNRPEDAAKYSLISSGSTIAGTEFAKNLAQEGNSRLTNMDIGVGSQAKGVGPDMPYAAHMENLARNMEEARIMYYRGKAFTEWHEKHPRVSVNKFQDSPGYKEASKKAREDLVNEFKEIPESHKYLEIHKDANGKKYYVNEGKAKYIKD